MGKFMAQVMAELEAPAAADPAPVMEGLVTDPLTGAAVNHERVPLTMGVKITGIDHPITPDGFQNLGGGSASLNAGSELDDEIVLPELEEDYPVMALEEELAAVDAAAGRIQDIMYLGDAIQRVGGMNQGFALEGQKLIEGFDGGAPIGFYTKLTTATRLKTAMESLTAGIWAAIAVGIVALLGLIGKFMDVFSKTSGGKTVSVHGAGGRSFTYQRIMDVMASEEEAAATMQTALTRSLELVRNFQHSLASEKVTVHVDGKAHQCGSIGELVEHVPQLYNHSLVRNYLLGEDELLLSKTLASNDYTTAMLKLVKALPDLKLSLEMKIRPLSQSLDSITVTQLQLIQIPMRIDLHGPQTLSEAASWMAIILHDTTPSNQKYTLEQLMQNLLSVYHQMNVPAALKACKEIVLVLDVLQQHLEKLQAELRKRDSATSLSDADRELVAAMRHAIVSCAQDVAGLSRLIHEFKHGPTTLSYCSKQSIALFKLIVKTCIEHSQVDGEAATWKALFKELKAVTHATNFVFHN